MVGRKDDPNGRAPTQASRQPEDTRSLIGYLLMGLALLALAICIGAAAVGSQRWTLGAGVVAIVIAAAGSVWVYLERRRVAQVIGEPDNAAADSRR